MLLAVDIGQINSCYFRKSFSQNFFFQLLILILLQKDYFYSFIIKTFEMKQLEKVSVGV